MNVVDLVTPSGDVTHCRELLEIILTTEFWDAIAESLLLEPVTTTTFQVSSSCFHGQMIKVMMQL